MPNSNSNPKAKTSNRQTVDGGLRDNEIRDTETWS